VQRRQQCEGTHSDSGLANSGTRRYDTGDGVDDANGHRKRRPADGQQRACNVQQHAGQIKHEREGGREEEYEGKNANSRRTDDYSDDEDRLVSKHSRASSSTANRKVRYLLHEVGWAHSCMADTRQDHVVGDSGMPRS
jgi:hypothetical protein